MKHVWTGAWTGALQQAWNRDAESVSWMFLKQADVS